MGEMYKLSLEILIGSITACVFPAFREKLIRGAITFGSAVVEFGIGYKFREKQGEMTSNFDHYSSSSRRQTRPTKRRARHESYGHKERFFCWAKQRQVERFILIWDEFKRTF